MSEIFGDETFWALVALVIFIGILVYMKVPGTIAAALDRRSAKIAADLAEAKTLRQEAELLVANYRKKAGEAEREAAEIVAQAKREADALSGEAEARINDYVTRRTKLAEQKIAQAEAQALQEVKARSVDVAIAAAEKVLAIRVKDGEAGRLIERAIGDVRSRLN